jgi:hypothetical protein
MLSFFLAAIASLATAYILPSSAAPSITSLDDKCSFTLFQRQHSFQNYIQLNTIVDHPNDVVIDVASLRPATAFNSYARVAHDRVFAVAGLLDDERLTITSKDAGDLLRFEIAGMSWTSEDAQGRIPGKVRGNWCEVEQWSGSVSSRVCVNIVNLCSVIVLTSGRNGDWTARSPARRYLVKIERMGLQLHVRLGK